MSRTKYTLAIFASGNGTNAEAIIRYFKNHLHVRVAAIYSNNKKAYVLERARKHNIPTVVFTREEFASKKFSKQILKHNYDLIVLAGFMWLVPASLTLSCRDKIINIHPALLPKYGGKGMYGDHVHNAVINSKDRESGITIHYVNEYYDEGSIIFQARCKVLASDTVPKLAERIHQLEHLHYPVVIENIFNKKKVSS